MFANLKKRTVIFALVLISAVGLAACSGGASAANKPVDVQITLTEFKIEASTTEFKVGVPYHFVVTNNGSVAHEIEIMPPMSGEVSTEQVQQSRLAGMGQDQLPAGATASFDYTFTQAYPAGALEFACHLPGHFEAGMHTPITVSK